MPTCENCGSHVTRAYVRVFGQHGRVIACCHCSTRRTLSDGDGVPERDEGLPASAGGDD
jgi:hypothetical protein